MTTAVPAVLFAVHVHKTVHSSTAPHRQFRKYTICAVCPMNIKRNKYAMAPFGNQGQVTVGWTSTVPTQKAICDPEFNQFSHSNISYHSVFIATILIIHSVYY